MLHRLVLILLVAMLGFVVDGADQCIDVKTSEGLRTLNHEQTACAPLEVGENETDKGTRFLTCSYGIVHTQPCSNGLRYDTVHKFCTYPGQSTCQLEGDPEVNMTTTLTPSQITVAEIPIVTSTEKQTQNQLISTTQATSTESLKSSTTKQPIPPVPSGKCSVDTCNLPDCFCYGSRPNMSTSDTPMFITLTFDDAVTTTVFDGFFKSLLVENKYNLYNPNGCNIRAAFYVSNEYTDYNFVKTLAGEGNEIASHTVNHRLPPGDTSTDYQDAVTEITGMREKVLQGTGDKTISDSIVGFRAPYLRVAHNVQFEALRNNGFLYDTSITNIEIYQGKDPVWPFTLDYIIPTCTNLPCPTVSFPGFWEVPINGFIGSNNYSCSMIDVCSVGSNVFTASQQEWYTFYKNNFDKYFYPIKVPMHLFTHGSMFLRSPPSYPAMIDWFQDLQLTQKDVWLVTPKMVIEWMKNPLTNSQMIAQKWGC